MVVNVKTIILGSGNMDWGPAVDMWYVYKGESAQKIYLEQRERAAALLQEMRPIVQGPLVGIETAAIDLLLKVPIPDFAK